MTIRRPSTEDLIDLSDRYHLNLNEDEIAVFYDLTRAVLDGYDELDQYPDPVREVTSAVRIPGPRPASASASRTRSASPACRRPAPRGCSTIMCPTSTPP